MLCVSVARDNGIRWALYGALTSIFNRALFCIVKTFGVDGSEDILSVRCNRCFRDVLSRRSNWDVMSLFGAL